MSRLKIMDISVPRVAQDNGEEIKSSLWGHARKPGRKCSAARGGNKRAEFVNNLGSLNQRAAGEAIQPDDTRFVHAIYFRQRNAARMRKSRRTDPSLGLRKRIGRICSKFPLTA